MLSQACEWISHLSILTLIINVYVVKAVFNSGDTSLVASLLSVLRRQSRQLFSED